MQFSTGGLMQVQRNKGEECSFMDLGGAVVNNESNGGN